MRCRERQHRAERVEIAEEVGLARDQQEHRQHREEGDREPRRAVLAVHAGEERRQLAVLGQRPREPRYPDQARVRGDHQDRGRQDADVVTQRGLEPRAERQRRNDSQHRVVLVLRPEQRGVVAAVVHHGQGDERDDRDPGEDPEHGDQHVVDRAGHVVVRVARLLGHVRHGLDSGVGDHRDREREDQLLVGGHRSEVDLVHKHRRVEDEDRAQEHQQDLGHQVGDREKDVQVRGLAKAADVQPGQHGDHYEAADDVPRVVPKAREERTQVVRHEERADRDRDDVVERQRPAGEERRDLVECLSRKGRRAACLGEHRRALGVRLRRQRKQTPGEDEHDRREPECVRRDQPERVIDRRADVPVGRREHPRHAEAATQAVLLKARHGPGEEHAVYGCALHLEARPGAVKAALRTHRRSKRLR